MVEMATGPTPEAAFDWDDASDEPSLWVNTVDSDAHGGDELATRGAAATPPVRSAREPMAFPRGSARVVGGTIAVLLGLVAGGAALWHAVEGRAEVGRLEAALSSVQAQTALGPRQRLAGPEPPGEPAESHTADSGRNGR